MELQVASCPSCKMDLSKIQVAMDQETLTFCPKCQFPLIQIAGKYKLEHVLRRGGCSVVYLARHVHLDHDPERVIKIIRPEFFTIQGMATRFRREVQLTAALSQRNEHIVRIFDDFGEIDGIGHFYVMEYLQGSTWSHMLKDPQRLPEISFCFHVFLQLCEAVQFAHEVGVVHRDLKPDNLMFVKRQRDPYFLKVLDFGIAKPISNEPQVTQGSLGTPAYMAPEQCLNQQTDARTDIYAMGVILFELLTGQTPFLPPQGEHSAFTHVVGVIEGQITQPPPSPHELHPERVSPALERVILQALEKKPEARFQSVEEFRSALLEVLKAEPSLSSERHSTHSTAPMPFLDVPSTEDNDPAAEFERAFLDLSFDDFRDASPPVQETPLDVHQTLLYSQAHAASRQHKQDATPSKEQTRQHFQIPTSASSQSEPIWVLKAPLSTPETDAAKDTEAPILLLQEKNISSSTRSQSKPESSGRSKQFSQPLESVHNGSDSKTSAEPLAPSSSQPSVKSIMKKVDRIQGPRDGRVEFFLVQSEDWDAEPLRFKELQDLVTALKTFVQGETFEDLYPGCRAKIILESFVFPKEVVELMMREDVELRIVPKAVQSAQSVQSQPQHSKPSTPKPSVHTPLPIEQEKGRAPTKVPKKELPQSTIVSQETLSSNKVSAVVQVQPSASKKASVISAPSEVVPPVPSDVAMHSSDVLQAIHTPTPSEMWDMSYDALDTPTAHSFSLGVWALLGVVALAVLTFVYAFFNTPNAETHADMQLRITSPGQVSSTHLPRRSLRQISLRPDRSTFALVPIIDSSTGKQDIFVLFASRENRRLLVYAPLAMSHILVRMKRAKGAEPGDPPTVPEWSNDLQGQGLRPKLRTYTGSLERLQLRKNGPLELVLPGENRNINAIPAFVQAGIRFPMDSMVLRVGEKPTIPQGQHSTWMWLSLLVAMVGGTLGVSLHRSNQRSF